MGLGVIGPAMVLRDMILVLLVIGLTGIVIGVWYRRRAKPANQWKGTLAIVLSCLLPVSTCCCGPDLLFWCGHGRFPLRSNPYGVVNVGMTKEEVIAVFGDPHLVRHDGSNWIYWTDAMGFCYYYVDFGPDGRVVRSGGD
ncbi:MAG TPA: hypothetical protein VHR72_03020 [Gemmataceae bacterium]|jgi:hypothetical protein|nr:hypothetical protein [Gemmataceae bacterium]